MRKKILLISNMYPNDKNVSYGIFIKNIENILLNNSFEVYKSVISGKSKNKIDKIIKYFKFISGTMIKYFNKVDIVYLHYISHSYVPLLILQPLIKKKMIIHIHGGDILRQKRVNLTFFKVKEYISKKAIKNSYRIIVPSNYYKKIVTEKYNVNEKNIFIYSSGGIDLNKFFKIEKNKNNEFILGYVGRIEEGKGIEYLCECLVKLKESISKLKLIVVGSGKKEKEFKEMIKNKRIESLVEFKGEISHEELVDFYNLFDCFIFPTEGESLGLVGLEAMACGVPVIGSKIGGLEDYLVDGKNGLFFNVGETQDLTRKILKFYKMTDKEKELLSINAIETSKKYDSIVEGERLVNFFEMLGE